MWLLGRSLRDERAWEESTGTRCVRWNEESGSGETWWWNEEVQEGFERLARKKWVNGKTGGQGDAAEGKGGVGNGQTTGEPV